MKLDDRFGDYLLFRRLAISPLGSTYRAGRLQARAIDRVVLLQRFDGQAVDRARLAAAASGRAAVLDRLTAPHFAQGLAAGTEEGVPYVAYDYLLGRTLEETLRRAAEVSAPPQTSYVVALVEQAAASLAAAARQRVGGVPIRHGFLVPELLLLSAEGRVYPLGFSHGAALVRQEPLRKRFAAYLAPETRTGEEPLGDDVYSLAAILFEGLTGAPPDPEQSTATQVDRAMFGRAGGPLSPAVQDLLKRGLAPAGARPGIEPFHRSLRRLVASTEGSPSQFQLAFFLHELFRDELETEAVEMQGERTARFDPLLLTPPSDGETAVAEAPAAVSTPPAPEEAPPAAPATAAPPPRPASSFLAGMALALAVSLAAGGLFHLARRGSAAEPPAEAPAAGAQEAEIQRLVAAGAADLQQRLHDEYEPRLTRLRRQLEAAEAARAARRRRQPSPAATAVSRPGPPQVAVAASPTPPDAAAPIEAPPGNAMPAADAAFPAEPAAGNESAGPAVPDAPPDPAAAGPPAGSASPGVPTDGLARPATGEPETGREQAPADQAADQRLPGDAAPRDEPAPPAPAVEPPVVPAGEPAGATLDAGGGAAARPADEALSPPRLLAPPQPRYPSAAQRLRKQARVRVRVLVDAEGRAAETELLSEPAGFGFDKSALQAAAKTRWEPARRNGRAVSTWAILTIDFRL